MKKARTKKLRGGKRKLSQAPAEATPERTKQQKITPKTTAGQKTAEQRAAGQKTALARPPADAPAEQRASKKDRPARQPSNVLKTQSATRPDAPVATANGAATDAEVEHWISMIRQGGLDRKVKVKGKTGALLVR